MMKDILLTAEKLDLNKCMALLDDAATGAVVSFVGTVRNHSLGREVIKLEFEAYKGMAVLEMDKIADYALQEFNIQHLIIHHRTGVLQVGEVPVVIVAAAAHRKAAFEACGYAIDTLKKNVPIWKKEFFKNGSHWVSAHP